MNAINPQNLLSAMRALELQSKNIKPADGMGANTVNDFSNVLGSAINQLNDVVIGSEQKMNAYTAGEEKDLVSVMVSMNQAKIGLTAAAEIRNKFIDFYQEISNMPI